MKQLDMSFGNPGFLQDYWKDKLFSVYNHDLSYANKGQDFLKKKIVDIHNEHMNANTTDKYIVIGNGASQMLQAIIAMLDLPVSAKVPYFNRFPRFTRNVGQVWTDDDEDSSVRICTIPNNPDGSHNSYWGFQETIFDLSYNWFQYHGYKSKEYDEDIMVFSLSKATGHASTRIGWALFKDHELAKKVEDWIEHNTSGVSYEAQMHAYKILNSQQIAYFRDSVFKYGRKVLNKRWADIRERYFDFEILNDDGMFLWCRSKIKPKGIKFINGSEFGVSDDYFRINIGVSDEIFNKFIKLYPKRYKKSISRRNYTRSGIKSK